ncbi:nucleoside permease [Pelagicoccus mobilis]|uniref:Nucleoside permease n=1 Tax=Pelagicoccus mobilis TaxID=415221 RepID=A0A934RVM7_9BACT|nr:nucleoside permease [Pelagicoccus mobilis]MBK1875984.1 nucleoside permease [Pelagicoccus mobilis]
MEKSNTSTATSIRLSIMMFLQFFIWGSWFVTVGNYMTKEGMASAIGWAYSVGPLAAIISPLFLGAIADRFFPSEKVLGIVHIIGGLFVFLAPSFASAENTTPFILLLLGHTLFYMPTLGLTNTLCFHNMDRPEKQFPLIRVFGTIGWIAANVVVSKWLKADELALPLQIAGGAAILMGLYSFTLPHTPPPAKGQAIKVREILGLDALSLLKDRSFLIFIISSLLICIPLSAYYAFAPVYINAAGVEDPAFNMSFGQVSEIVFMVLLPVFLTRFGFKWVLAIGMLAWVVRYALFGFGAIDSSYAMLLGGIVLHGICYDFFFVTGQIYTDKKADKRIRGQAQGFLVLATLGLGMFIGAQASGQLFNAMGLADDTGNLALWKQFWFVPAGLALVILFVFLVLFKDKKEEA